MNNNFQEVINNFKEKYILNKYNQKNKEVIQQIRETLNYNKSELEEILKQENDLWETNYKTDKIYSVIEESIKEIDNKKSKSFGIGNIVAITTGDVYLQIELILKAIASNCKIMFISNPMLYSINKYICDVVQKILEKNSINKLNISIIKEISYKKKIIDNKEYIDCIIINQDYDNYSYFKKNTYAKTIYLDYGNINVYTDSAEYKEKVEEIANIADMQNMIVYNIKIDNIDNIIEEENNNFIYNTAIIYSKDIKKCMELYEYIKANNIFINKFDINSIKTGLKLEEFVFEKNVYIN